jgi:hypothetical protein
LTAEANPFEILVKARFQGMPAKPGTADILALRLAMGGLRF